MMNKDALELVWDQALPLTFSVPMPGMVLGNQ
jgi:hypothetical protein